MLYRHTDVIRDGCLYATDESVFAVAAGGGVVHRRRNRGVVRARRHNDPLLLLQDGLGKRHYVSRMLILLLSNCGCEVEACCAEDYRHPIAAAPY